jgi:hypothetical protein
MDDMGDFTRIHTGICLFRDMASEAANDYGRRDALARLASAAEATMDRDVQHDRDTLEALDYLEAQSGCRVAIIRRFRKALAEPEAIKRRQAAGDAYEAICEAVAGKR